MRPDFTNLRNRTKITFMATIDSYRSPFPHEELLERARRIRHVALDMDGTIYMGMSLFPWTKRFLSDLTEMGIGYSFLTNNPSKSIADYLHKLETLGIEATREEMYTTALATIDYIRSHYPTAKRLFLLGTPSMISEFEAAGFESTADSAEDVPDVVVAAFDMTLTYPRLCRAAWWASQGIPYIATNPDRVCPTDQPVVLVDCGCKYNIVRCLTKRNATVIRVPWDYDFTQIDYDGVMLSNGPGDPQQCGATIANIRKAIALGKPIFGICLGNQLLSIAAGATTFKLKYGHRSHNQPALMVGTDRAVITSQNHGFAVDTTTLDEDWEPYFVNLNDGTSEGIRHRTKPFFSVQFHPEASGGPVDTEFLFDDFIQNIEKCRK